MRKSPGRPATLIGRLSKNTVFDKQTTTKVERYQRKFKCGWSEAVRELIKLSRIPERNPRNGQST